jgi:hypothetical protein
METFSKKAYAEPSESPPGKKKQNEEADDLISKTLVPRRVAAISR